MRQIIRTCRRCDTDKPLTDEFFRRTGTSRVFTNVCRDCHKSYMRRKGNDTRLKNRQLVLQAYSGTIPCCSCCGESHTEFLSIDHIDGGGHQHRKELSYHVYEWLIKNNFPLGFRVLCHNCNFSLGKYGYCPHTRE